MEIEGVEVPGNIVGKFETMDPATEALLFDGSELRFGMVAITAEVDERFDEQASIGKDYYLLLMNRFARISNVTHRTTPNGPKVEFVATYEDGTQIKRSHALHHAWIVKKYSMPDYSQLKRISEPRTSGVFEIDPQADQIVGNVFENSGDAGWENQLQMEREEKPGMKFQTDN